MSDCSTFRQIERQRNIHIEADSYSSALGKWYLGVCDTPLEQFGAGDLSRACRQSLYVEHVVPYAITFLEKEPLAGELFDGELVVAMKFIPEAYWKAHIDLSERLREVFERALAVADDEEIIKNVKNLTDRLLALSS
jgi:CDI immunity proteins